MAHQDSDDHKNMIHELGRSKLPATTKQKEFADVFSAPHCSSPNEEVKEAVLVLAGATDSTGMCPHSPVIHASFHFR